MIVLGHQNISSVKKCERPNEYNPLLVRLVYKPLVQFDKRFEMAQNTTNWAYDTDIIEENVSYKVTIWQRPIILLQMRVLLGWSLQSVSCGLVLSKDWVSTINKILSMCCSKEDTSGGS